MRAISLDPQNNIQRQLTSDSISFLKYINDSSIKQTLASNRQLPKSISSNLLNNESQDMKMTEEMLIGEINTAPKGNESALKP